MSIRPVDLQVMVQKTAESSRINQHDSAKTDVAQQQFASQFQKEVEIHEQQVLQSNKSEQENIDKNGRGAKDDSRDKRKKRDRRDSEEQKDPMKSNSIFDVTI